MSEMLQRGHCQTSPQSGHWRKAAKPRRLSRSSACSPRASVASDGRRRAPPTRRAAPVPVAFGATRRSTSSTGGSGRAPIRSGSRSSRRRRSARTIVSSDGVALPRTRRGALEPGAHRGHVARVVARRLAVLVAGLVLLVHHDHARGPRPARRPPSARPTATRRSPRRSSRQASARSPSESALCSTATWSPKAPRSRLTVCGVSPISGTSTMAPAPCGQHPPHRLEIDQRLAAAGDAEEHGAVARLQRLDRPPAPACWSPVSVVGGGTAGKSANGIAHPLRLLDPRPARAAPRAREHAGGEAELVHHVPHRARCRRAPRAPRRGGAAWARA